MSDSIEIEITGREASLILKYGYSFPDQAIVFEKVAVAKQCMRDKMGVHESSPSAGLLAFQVSGFPRSRGEKGQYK